MYCRILENISTGVPYIKIYYFTYHIISSTIFTYIFVSGEMGSGSGVTGGCDMLSWLPWLFSRTGAESWSCYSTSQSVCGIVSMSRVCYDCMALSVSLWDSSTT